ncbi:hypothetical protein SK128_025175 [Halocaridina rubra]|uniref:MAM domain-containing protein n=1 Tax=Halocaridina rubra TaxID=373956 RepID=A0AAN8WN74_HALRR
MDRIYKIVQPFCTDVNHNMYLDPNDTVGADEFFVGDFRSPSFSVASVGCVTLDWKKIDEAVATLYVVLYAADTGEEMGLLMSEDVGTTEEYRSTNLEITFKGTFTLSIAGIVSKQWDGILAFNRVLFHEGPCNEIIFPGYLFCDFETTTKCGFHTSLAGDTATWTLGSGHPAHDHTAGSFLGHEVFFEASRARGKIAHLATPNMTMGDTLFCTQFWYFDDESQEVTFSVYSQQGEEKSDPLWLMRKEYESEWRGVAVSGPVDTEKELIVVWEAVGKETSIGVVAIDDVTVKQGRCPEPASCNFDLDICLWTQSSVDELNWITVNSLGDLHDHTAGNGSLLGLVTGGETNPGDTAILESEPVTITDTACLTFWYNLYGSSVGSLTVSQHSSPLNKFDIWLLEGGVSIASGNWSYASLPIQPSFDANVLITLKARVSDEASGEKGHIAVDDIILKLAEACTVKPSSAQLPTPSPPPVSPTPSPAPGYLYMCDYEANHNVLCDWIDISQNISHRWNVVKCCLPYHGSSVQGPAVNQEIREGSLTTEGIGPVGDHTLGTGHYVTCNRAPTAGDINQKDDLIATLQSPSINISTNSCFVFWYFTWGQNSQIKVEFNGENRWSRQGSSGNIWKSCKLSVPPSSSDQFINIVSILGNDLEYIFTSVDDTYLYETTCDNVDVGSSSNLQCNLEYQRICNWQQATEDSADWQWRNGTNGAFSTDHSYQTDAGHYLQLSSDQAGVIPGQIAVLDLSFYDNMPAKDYCFQLYVRYGGFSNGDIHVLVGQNLVLFCDIVAQCQNFGLVPDLTRH